MGSDQPHPQIQSTVLAHFERVETGAFFPPDEFQPGADPVCEY